MNNILRFVYIVFIGILVALFVGIGIDTFYKAPERPNYKSEISKSTFSKSTPTEEDLAAMQKESENFQKENEEYQNKTEIYSRNVSIMAAAAAIIIVAASLFFLSKFLLIADGLLLGGVMTLGYGLIRGFRGDSGYYRFIVVAAGLAMVICIGYFRFMKENRWNKN